MVKRQGKSAEDKRAEMEALHAQLAASVEALRSSERWAAYLEFCRSFHRYSLNNLLLIMAQRPSATRVAGYRAWQSKGRQVRKGERGIRIFGTGTVKVRQDDEAESLAGEAGEEPKRRRVFFPVSVFDIEQTDVMPGHEDVSEVARVLTGDDVHGIAQRVTDYLTAQGVRVEVAPLVGPNGYSAPADPETGQPVRVVIAEHLAPAQRAKTALHEAAHIVLGHLDDDHSEYLAHRGRYEVEAESVAYVVAGMLGLDSSDYSTGYVAGWARSAEPDVLQSTAGRVLAAVRTLVEALHLADAAEVSEADEAAAA